MQDLRVAEGLATDNIKAARKRVREARRRGQNPNLDDIAESRGLVVAERENSIMSDAWVPLAVAFVVGGYLTGQNVACMSLGAILILATWWEAGGKIERSTALYMCAVLAILTSSQVSQSR